MSQWETWITFLVVAVHWCVERFSENGGNLVSDDRGACMILLRLWTWIMCNQDFLPEFFPEKETADWLAIGGHFPIPPTVHMFCMICPPCTGGNRNSTRTARPFFHQPRLIWGPRLLWGRLRLFPITGTYKSIHWHWLCIPANITSISEHTNARKHIKMYLPIKTRFTRIHKVYCNVLQLVVFLYRCIHLPASGRVLSLGLKSVWWWRAAFGLKSGRSRHSTVFSTNVFCLGGWCQCIPATDSGN